MLNSTVPAVDPAVGYWQWVTSIMHAPETLGFSTCTARAKMWRFNEGSQTLRLHVGPNSKPWTTSRPRSIIMTPGPRPLPETILSGTGKAQGDGSLSRQLCTEQRVCITRKQSNLVHGCLCVGVHVSSFTRRVVFLVLIGQWRGEVVKQEKQVRVWNCEPCAIIGVAFCM